METLAKQKPEILKEIYGISDMSVDPQILIEQAGRRRGCLLPGGGVNFDRAEEAILHDFRAGRLGRMTLDAAPEEA